MEEYRSTGDPGQELNEGGEAAWMEVVRKMDETYEELVQQQVAVEEKNAELEEAQGFIDSVLASMSDALIVCDVAGRIQEVNRALEGLVGRSGQELAGEAFYRLFAEADQDTLRTFPQVIRNAAVTDCEVRLLDTAGEPRPVAMNCTSRFDQRGRLVGMVLIARDVGELRRAYQDLDRAHTELQQAQHQLVQSEKMASLGRMIAGVAHELNNPIAFVTGNVHVLARYGERLRRYLDRVHAEPGSAERERLRAELRIDELLDDLDDLISGTREGADRVASLVQELRRYSSGSRGEPEAFDLVPLVTTAAQWVRKGTRGAPAIRLDLPEAAPMRGRSGQIHQVFVNLLQNAVDMVAGVEEAEVAVTGAVHGDWAVFRVEDNGPGMEPDTLEKLFEPFFTNKPVGQGTGLGLYIAYGTVAEHGGRLEAANRAGGGAELRVTLPLSPGAASAPHEPASDGG
jgi:two-component system sensor histidine kinase HupT/HoxJ